MRFNSQGDVPLLEVPEGAPVEEWLRRYDPGLRRRKRGRFLVAGGVKVIWRRGLVAVQGSERLARGLGYHLGGEWRVAPGDGGEQIEDMLRVYVPRKLVPAELAIVLKPVLPGVVIRDDPKLGLFWFDDEDSELIVSAWAVEGGPPVVGEHEVLYECGIDDVHGPTGESAEQAWRIAERLREEAGGVPVDRYGFRVEAAGDLS